MNASQRERLQALIARAGAVKAERQTLREGLKAREKELTALGDKLAALRAMTVWAELDSGQTVDVGREVRYLGKNYVCIKAHDKALARRPVNREYWAQAADE